jgi:hypothetical protein
MGGGLLQLVAYGAQDVYLTGNPQITFFKVVYRRHTNFAIESIVQTFNGEAQYGNTITCTVSRNGDLINRAYVELTIPGLEWNGTNSNKLAYVNYLGLRLLKNVVIEIGGQQIDKHYSEWMYIWNELSLPIGKRYGYDKMVGKSGLKISKRSGETKLYVPLEFWFCRNVGLALPLIALQYHEVKFKIEFADKEEIAYNFFNDEPYAVQSEGTPTNYYITNDGVSWTKKTGSTLPPESSSITYTDDNGDDIVYEILTDTVLAGKLDLQKEPTSGSAWAVDTLFNYDSKINYTSYASTDSSRIGQLTCQIYVDYIFLDTDERRKFAQLTHEYLIEQLQFTGEEDIKNQIRLNFNHPVKQLIWVVQRDLSEGGESSSMKNWNNFSISNDIDTIGTNPLTKGSLKLNGKDRIASREGRYFDLVQPYQHHTNVPKNGGINVYSFALKPEEHQPSGTLNMSRIDSAHLYIYKHGDVNTNSKVLIYATNYNVLRVMSGMGGLAYSN